VVVAAGAVEILVNLLTSTDPELLEASTKALANLLKPTQSQIKAVRRLRICSRIFILGVLFVVRTCVTLCCSSTTRVLRAWFVFLLANELGVCFVSSTSAWFLFLLGP